MSSVLKVSDALEHLDDEQIAVALPHLLRAKAVAAGPRAASNRTAGVLDALGLAQDADEIDLRAELGVWFTPRPEHPTLTELRAILPAGDAANLKAAVFAHAQELRESTPMCSTAPCTTRSALSARTLSSCSLWPTCT